MSPQSYFIWITVARHTTARQTALLRFVAPILTRTRRISVPIHTIAIAALLTLTSLQPMLATLLARSLALSSACSSGLFCVSDADGTDTDSTIPALSQL